ncbi:helix-turn-helix transcriptional regulator [Limosilactobacillus mucosae]|uniref:helix-turn-helix transcriptional regulator n=1 Tax=Limosilactobacillus mucosae TaxID=97478 RepID=UPI00233E6C92|nr:helix-turn-helix transcriptional regulator [Limosilactobacillus mucosae]MDC2841700.1 helix-turn-helix transcriptional regulator [Limosilactobacillus mucosae]
MFIDHFKKSELTIDSDIPIVNPREPIVMFYQHQKQQKIIYARNHQKELITFADEAGTIRPHRNTHFVLAYVLHGKLTACIEQHPVFISQGMGYLIDPQIMTYEELADGTEVMFIDFSTEIAQMLCNELASIHNSLTVDYLRNHLMAAKHGKHGYLEYIATYPQENQPLKNILDSLQQELMTPRIAASLFQRGLIIRLFDQFTSPHIFHEKIVQLDGTHEQQIVNQIDSYILAYLGNVNRQQIAHELNYNADYLNRIFKQERHISIMSYARAIRLNQAKAFLINTQLTVNTIAEKLGFSSVNYFHEFFKTQTGLTPQLYRQTTQRKYKP